MDVTLLLVSMAPAPAASGVLAMSTSQIVMLALAVAGLTILMLSTHRKMRDRRQQPRSTARQRYAELERGTKAKRGIEEVMLELDQLSRQVHGRLDTKFAKLEAVIRDADRRIAQLSRLLRAASNGPACDITLDREDPHEPPPDSNVEQEDRPHAAIYRLADAGLSVREIAEEVGKPAGEIDLVLALRKTKEQAGKESGLVHATQPGPDD